MKNKLFVLGLLSATAIGFSACSTTSNTNTAHGNSNTAAVVNANQAPIMNGNTGVGTTGTTGTNSTTTTTKTTVNYNGTAKENEAQRTSVEAEAKSAGRTIGTGAEDWWLWGKTRAALAAENDLQDSTINVDVSNSVVTLTGAVKTKEQVAKADAVAKKVTGVKSVMNKLTVNPNASVMTTNTSSANHSGNAKGNH
jgi:osmotically-inducible protein OsmY